MVLRTVVKAYLKLQNLGGRRRVDEIIYNERDKRDRGGGNHTLCPQENWTRTHYSSKPPNVRRGRRKTEGMTGEGEGFLTGSLKLRTDVRRTRRLGRSEVLKEL